MKLSNYLCLTLISCIFSINSHALTFGWDCQTTYDEEYEIIHPFSRQNGTEFITKKQERISVNPKQSFDQITACREKYEKMIQNFFSAESVLEDQDIIPLMYYCAKLEAKQSKSLQSCVQTDFNNKISSVTYNDNHNSYDKKAIVLGKFGEATAKCANQLLIADVGQFKFEIDYELTASNPCGDLWID